MCNTIPEDENGVQQDINGPESDILESDDIQLLRLEKQYLEALVAAYKNATGKLSAKNEELKTRTKELEDGVRYIAKDMAALETDCAHDQCDMYVMKAKDLMGWTK